SREIPPSIIEHRDQDRTTAHRQIRRSKHRITCLALAPYQESWTPGVASSNPICEGSLRWSLTYSMRTSALGSLLALTALCATESGRPGGWRRWLATVSIGTTA